MKSPIAVRKKSQKPSAGKSITVTSPAQPQFPAPPPIAAPVDTQETIDLERRRDQLSAKVAELQWDLGGLTYEMASRNRMRPDVLVKRAAELQEVDAELGEIERILRMERTGVAALCLTCGAPHSSGAVYCWQCGTSLLEQIPGATIAARNPN
ncbi:MAG: zinc ribbon domain-containing protein [Thermoleophilaceae bacterium]|nr:zinc ribbon domain-containing protein [Thermoleophilaceae bacterium]